MHRLHNEPRIKNGPETRGVTIHWASQYDVFTGLLGLAANGPNSRMVIELANIQAGDRVLDVGCGAGSLTLTAHSYAGPTGRVHGIDAAPEMIDVARKKAAPAQPRRTQTQPVGLEAPDAKTLSIYENGTRSSGSRLIQSCWLVLLLSLAVPDRPGCIVVVSLSPYGMGCPKIVNLHLKIVAVGEAKTVRENKGIAAYEA